MLLNSTAEAIYGLDLEGDCTFCNPACLRLLGYGVPKDLLGKNMHDLMHHTRADGSTYSKQDCEIYVAVREGRASHVTHEVLWRADGTSFQAEYWSYPMYKTGELVGAVVNSPSTYPIASGQNKRCDSPKKNIGSCSRRTTASFDHNWTALC